MRRLLIKIINIVLRFIGNEVIEDEEYRRDYFDHIIFDRIYHR